MEGQNSKMIDKEVSDEQMKLVLVEEREKDLLARQQQFEQRMKETQDRFAKDRSNYEQKYNERLHQLEEQEQ